MFCKHCGTKIDDNANFCVKCGKPVDATDMELSEKGTGEGSSNNTGAKNVFTKKRMLVAGIVVISLIIMGIALAITIHSAKKLVKGIEEAREEIGNAIESGDKSDTASSDNKSQDSSDEKVEKIESLERPFMLSVESDESDLLNINPSVPKIQVNEDLSNVINQSEYQYYSDDFKKAIAKNQFAVIDGWNREFFEVYEYNRYSQTPNFVTVDSLMHTYHIYFAYLLKNIEKNHLYDELKLITEEMLKASYDQYKTAKGTDFEDAALRNVEFFSVATVLLDSSAKFPQEAVDVVNAEYDLIMAAQGVDYSPIRGGDFEDYSQYKPRGYYEGDEQLEKYFRTMMWYGRIQFNENVEDMDRSALLMTLALKEGSLKRWESIYSVTSYFAGASDDLGYYDYKPVVTKVYGDSADISDVVNSPDKWNEFHKYTARLDMPRINSIPIEENEENVILGYRFMGQRFTIDATIMQELIYSRVGDRFNVKDEHRMLPDALDVPASLGSAKALEILESENKTQYEGYAENLGNLQKEFKNNDGTLWKASLYAGWLNTLRPLLEEKGEGYPSFMQSEEWKKKDLETFAGSYTELKHDTILYAKQVMAEMGGGWEEDLDDRGYVQPEPVVYSRFADLSRNTAAGLKDFGYISDEDAENLENLANLADSLKVMSVKELNNELLTDDEYDLIRDYGGQLEHLWLDVMRAQSGQEYPSTDEYPAALVVDVATDPNGTVLEMGTGNPSLILVAVAVDGKIRICEGSVYNFYQFEQPISERLTDKEWHRMLGIVIDDYNDPSKDLVEMEHPEWTVSYRVKNYYDY